MYGLSSFISNHSDTSSINTEGKILFIEDLGEYHYHIDRMLISLKRAGYFDNCNGLIVGDFSDLRKNTTPFGKNIKEIILDAVKEFDFPVLFDFPAGHEELNMPIILGRDITMDVNNSTFWNWVEDFKPDVILFQVISTLGKQICSEFQILL